ncbi:tetratricopeptide repeat protein [Micromonospora sp. WMMD710]|uniref:caspase, EACC1-associated type n=1 Tax=Micromonospora sp. WMMD710 TaxID=3016085 RepID=UPI0024169995|nr:tetratricopeptide repeat protein [Micromonospora sp. WMMD710]MDG4759084.1 tetratricopeptide repeat protein [Micromonospora sp. WMMD710]
MYRALLVCNSVYEADPRLHSLHGPRTDGRLLGAALTDDEMGMFATAQVTILFDASRSEIAEAANRFFSDAEPDDVVLFYFSGHGRSRNQKLYLCARDTVAGLLPGTAVSNDTLNDIIGDSVARAKVIVLDCCHSGAFKGPVAVERLLAGKGRFVLTATAAFESAADADGDDLPSPFTSALVNGLLHGADDKDGDGAVDLADLYAYLQGALHGSSEPRHRFDGFGNVPIARRPVPAADEIPEQRLSSGSLSASADEADHPFLDGTTSATVLSPRRVSRFRSAMRRDVGRPVPRRGSAADFMRAALLMREGRLTRAGALLFGEDPTAVVPTATVQCTHFHGPGKDAPMDKRTLGGTIPEQITQARDFVADLAQLGEAPTADGAVTERVYRYPMIAVREIIANALVHRDYQHREMCVHVRVFSDRIEVTSPGVWSGADLADGERQPLSELRGESRQRNFWLAHVLSWNKLVESEGAGIPRAVRDCHQHGSAEPVVVRSGEAVTVTIFPRAPLTHDSPQALVDNLPLGSAVFEGRNVGVLAEALLRAGGNSVVGRAAVYGLAGIGKTELALRYAHTFRDRYRVVWWITADTPQNIDLGLAAMSTRLHPVGTLADAQVWAVDWLQNNRDWLLILDDVQDVTDVEPLLGQLTGRGEVVITTRRSLGVARWARLGLTSVRLDALDRAASVRMLTRLTGLDDEHGAGRLADELGGHPLALEQAAAYLGQHAGMSFDDYHDLLTHRFGTVTADAGEGGSRGRTAAQVWRVSMGAVTVRSPLASQVWSVLAWLAPDALPEDVLLPLTRSGPALGDALALLASYSLVNRADGLVSSHRLVQAVARSEQTSGEDDAGAAALAATVLRSAIPADPIANVAGWPRWNLLLPHIDALLDNSGPLRLTPNLLYAVEQAATYRLFQGQVPAAITHFEQVVAGRRRMLGDEHPDTLTSRHNLASAYQTAGRVDEAIVLHEHVLSVYRRMLGDEHPDTLASQNNLARAYQSAGRAEQAIELLLRVFTASRRVLGEDHPDTLASRNNLALAIADEGRLPEAFTLLEQVLADRRRVLGDDHPATLATRHNLTYILQRLGRLDEAATELHRVLADRRRVLGDDHPDTLGTRSALALVLAAANRPDEAIRLLEQLLTDQERVLGEDHPGTRGTAATLYQLRSDDSPDHPRAGPTKIWTI